MSVNYKKIFTFFYRGPEFCKFFSEYLYSVCFLATAYTNIFYIYGSFCKTGDCSKCTYGIRKSRKINMQFLAGQFFCRKSSCSVS